MTTNITTLALNLLISERIDHRSGFAARISEQLNESKSVSADEDALRNDFIWIMNQCIENPNSAERDLFYELAQFFAQKFNGMPADMIPAA